MNLKSIVLSVFAIILFILFIYIVAFIHIPLNPIGLVLEDAHIIMPHDKAVSIVESSLYDVDRNTTFDEQSAYFSLGIFDYIPIPAWMVSTHGVQKDNPPGTPGYPVGGLTQVNAITGNFEWVDQIQ